ncbi:MAG TPA: coproporphyrinogen III oxidase, partial [Cytophagaceae bacterium]|nr:coproporphyrinogen III oxidase [Cytophagaceae bacterium]
MTKEKIAEEFKDIQDYICKQLEMADGKALFREDVWQRKEGGGGRSRIVKEGNILEKGGVGFSAVHGETPEKIRQALALPPVDFFATGVSIVLHPNNPHVPIIHMNIRYFEMSNGTYWFGGGIDLTPHFIVREDAQFFHKKLQAHCNRHHPEFYDAFKKWADDYFYIPHRDETRGIGGIFFDHL